MHPVRIIHSAAFLLLFLQPPNEAGATEDDQNPVAGSPATLAVWDTGQTLKGPYSMSDLTAKSGWSPISTPEKTAAFKGDAVITNGRILGVLRKHGYGMELYSLKSYGPAIKLNLQLLSSSGQEADHLDQVALVENTKGAACLEASYKTAKGETVTAKFRLKRGDISIQVNPGATAGRLKVECPARFVVLPDFFADDIVIDARTIPPDTAELASDNFLLHLSTSGDAIAMCVFENRKQDVLIALSGKGEQRSVTASEIPFEGKKIWAAILDAPQIWHTRELKSPDTGEILPLDWKIPFAAQWRWDFAKSTGLTDSWEMLQQQEDGNGYIKPSWLGAEQDHLGADRLRWNTVLGRYPYPCWSDREGHSYLQPLKSKVLQFQGPAVVYPIGRVKQTPLDAYTVMDVMRNTLGVGPCEYILDLEGQKWEYRGRAPCSVRDELGAIYE